MKGIYRLSLTSFAILSLALFAWNQTSSTPVSPYRQLLSYQTSSTRTKLLNDVCDSTPRNELVIKEDVNIGKDHIASVSAALKIDGYT